MLCAFCPLFLYFAKKTQNDVYFVIAGINGRRTVHARQSMLFCVQLKKIYQTWKHVFFFSEKYSTTDENNHKHNSQPKHNPQHINNLHKQTTTTRTPETQMRMSYQHPPNRDADEETAEVLLSTTTDPTTRDHRLSQRRSAMVAGVLMMLMMMAGGAVLRREGASSTTTTTATTAVPDRTGCWEHRRCTIQVTIIVLLTAHWNNSAGTRHKIIMSGIGNCSPY